MPDFVYNKAAKWAEDFKTHGGDISKIGELGNGTTLAHGVVATIDVSGFTKLSQRLAERAERTNGEHDHDLSRSFRGFMGEKKISLPHRNIEASARCNFQLPENSGNGGESLREMMNKIMGSMITQISLAQLDIVKFAGDALICMQDKARFSGMAEDAQIICDTLHCCLKIMKIIRENYSKQRLDCHCGIGWGGESCLAAVHPFLL